MSNLKTNYLGPLGYGPFLHGLSFLDDVKKIGLKEKKLKLIYTVINI